jgi:hypothetical protein
MFCVAPHESMLHPDENHLASTQNDNRGRPFFMKFVRPITAIS